MRKLCPNTDREDALETILEVPIPEEMFNSLGTNINLRCENLHAWMKGQTSDKWSSPVVLGRINELRFLLYHVGSPLIPLQVHIDKISRPVKDSTIVSLIPSLLSPFCQCHIAIYFIICDMMSNGIGLSACTSAYKVKTVYIWVSQALKK